ncbi:SLC13 family permease [Henriciella mobilis]|uniref:SLC13 family permease n=1 Tax=Henriciella mobilis TaxID=2305467 RepID=A0A399RJK5_9PROT|nr:SLC13 family permease [Henriciella mobilis]RIJ18241.1 SLC13 family permease [Henriciella mobilis]RIJ24951.1 SLC13 family permease [Henriciella mobilis]RIJ30012.1 SLC13 family permease [Henriciella mobilis]
MFDLSLPEPVQIALVLALIVAVFAGFVRERIPSDVVALLAMAALLILGLLSVDDALDVFSNAAPITIGAMFVLSAALERTGVIGAVGNSVVRLSKTWSPFAAIAVLMLVVIVLSAFMNNTPIVVILIPVAIRLAQSVNISPARLLIPLSFASIFGGMTTLIGTSTNLLVDGVVQNSGLTPFGIFEITGAGLCLALAGTVYMTLVGRWFLPDRETLATMLPSTKSRRFVAQVLVPVDSVLVGKTIKETGFTAEKGFTVIDVMRENRSRRTELSTLSLQGGDRLVIRSPVSEMLSLREAGDVAIGSGSGSAHAFEPVQTTETRVMEGVVGPQSRLVGRPIVGAGLVRLYGVYAIAIHRRGENIGLGGKNIRFDIGDTVLVEGPPAGLRQMFDDGMLSNLTETEDRPIRRDKAPIAIGAVALVMILAAFGVMPIAGLALIAAAGVIALGCLDHQEAYKSIQWEILMLIFGMLAVGKALETTGAAAFLVDGIAGQIGHLPPLVTLAAVYLITSVLTEFVSNNATAILMTPIAIGLAASLGVDARPFVVAVMFAASASFATPIGYQTNTLVYTAGGYKFTDFALVGLPLNLLFFAVSMLVIPAFWPLA